MYFYNDNLKIETAINATRVVIDWGPISTLSYNQIRSILEKTSIIISKTLFNGLKGL